MSTGMAAPVHFHEVNTPRGIGIGILLVIRPAEKAIEINILRRKSGARQRTFRVFSLGKCIDLHQCRDPA